MNRRELFAHNAPLVGAFLLGLGLLTLLSNSATLVFDGNLNLSPTSRTRGDLIVLSGNVNFQAGSQIDGSLLMLCCNLLVNGTLAGDLAMLSGNLNLGPQSYVRGNVSLAAVNHAQAPTARVDGAIMGGIGLWWMFARALCLAPALLIAGGLLLSPMWRQRRAYYRAKPQA